LASISHGLFHTAGQRPVSHRRPKACFIPKANGLFHTSPGQRPGITAPRFTSQANGLPHTVHNKNQGRGIEMVVPTVIDFEMRGMNRALSALICI
jgi:hypothetical protein